MSVSIFPLSFSFFLFFLSLVRFYICFAFMDSLSLFYLMSAFPHIFALKMQRKGLSPSHLLCLNGHFGLVLFDVCLFPYFCLQNGKNIVSISDSLSFLSLSLHLPVICFAQTDSLFLFYLTSAFSRILAYKMEKNCL